MCGGGVYGGGGPRPPVEDCRDEYELQLMDWQHIYPNASTIRSNIRVVLQKSYSDRTINVFLEDGIRIGTVFSLGLRNCMDKYRYDAVLLRRDGKLYVRAFKK